MALDTRGLASGFQAGFGMADQYYRGQAQDKRAEEQLAMQREKFDMQKDEAERARDLETIQLAFGKIANGMDVSEEEIEVLKRNPRYWSALDPEIDGAIEQAYQVIDPNSPADINDPESIEALNRVVGPDINKGAGRNKRIAAAVPGPDGNSLMFELDVEGEDGSKYRAPVTERRSADEDDPVRAVPVEGLVRQVKGIEALRKALQTPEAQQQATRMYNLLTGKGDEGTWERIEGPGGSILQRNTKTGEIKQVIGRAPQRSGYYDRPTSTMKDAEWMVANGIADTLEEAYEKISNSRGGADPYQMGQDELNYVEGRIEEIQDIKSDPAQWRTLPQEDRDQIDAELGQLRSRRDDVAERLYSGGGVRGLDTGRRQPSQEGGGGQPKPEPKQESRAAPKPEPEPTRERGQQPGQSPAEQADALLKEALGL